MTRRLTLGPVAMVVQSDHAVWTGHSNQCSEVDAEALQPQRTLEAGVD